MARPRKLLSEQLHKILDHVYFQPPESIKLQYPCIIYTLEKPSLRRASDKIYTTTNKYQITLISKTPEDPIASVIPGSFDYCTPDRVFVSDNLYHYNFTLFY